jgi:hypothetical protein
MTVTFTTLPLEVRNEIYKSLFNTPRCKSPKTPGDNESQFPKMFKLPLYATILPRKSLPSNPAILGTCRQIYHETVPFLYADRAFKRYVMENIYFDDRIVKTCVFTDTNFRHVQHCQIYVRFSQTPEAIARHIAQLANENYTLKRLELIFMVDSYHWTLWVKEDVEHHQRLISKLTRSSKVIDSIAAVKVLHNIDVVLTNIDVRDDKHTLGDLFAPLVHAIATAKAWSCGGTMYECSHRETGKEEHEWVWHLQPPVTKRS